MHLILNPVRMDTPLTLTRLGDTLVFNGHAVDLAARETCDWIVRAQVEGQEWVVEIILPHAVDAPEETRFPRPITVTADGPVELPPWGSVTAEDLAALRELIEAEGDILAPDFAPAALATDAHAALQALPGPEGWTTHD